MHPSSTAIDLRQTLCLDPPPDGLTPVEGAALHLPPRKYFSDGIPHGYNHIYKTKPLNKTIYWKDKFLTNKIGK
jgi:hypothetical protein